MASRFNPGDTAFLVESNRIVREVSVLKVSGGFYTIRFVDSRGGMRVRENRLFPTREEAEASMPPKESKRPFWM